jgi:hypothetical protein
MLFEKSKFAVGDIISLKITSGEEIIGKYVSEDMSELVVGRPLMLAMTAKGPAFAPLMMTTDPDKNYGINKQLVMTKGETAKEVADQYTFQTTGIQPVSAGSIALS